MARSSSERATGSSVSSVCRSSGSPAAAAIESNVAFASIGSVSRWGQPPTRSTPAAIASRSSARESAPARPVIGHDGQRHDLHVDEVADALAHQ